MQPWPNFEPKSSNKKKPNETREEYHFNLHWWDIKTSLLSTDQKWSVREVERGYHPKKTECLWKQMNSMLYLCLQCMWEKYVVLGIYCERKTKTKQTNTKSFQSFSMHACLYHKMNLAQCAWKIFSITKLNNEPNFLVSRYLMIKASSFDNSVLSLSKSKILIWCVVWVNVLY